MSALISACCCGDEPDPPDLSCCDCLASSYSIAMDISWTSICTDSTNSRFGTVDGALSYSGMVVTAEPCTIQYRNSAVRFWPSSTTGSITGANISLSYTPIDLGFDCVDQSLSNATLNAPSSPGGGLCGGSNPSPHEVGPLVCWHYYKSDGSAAYRWYHQTCVQSQDACSDPFFGKTWAGFVNAYSPEQSTCHEPPSAGWTVQTGQILYKCGVAFCAVDNYTSTTGVTNRSFSLTIT